ncbi:MAG TPA: Fur family transcriptional regulator [Acidimicrobiales bacterium]|nr:Fur family transcriptional regulator [Acidimicrobiales bacterium]
MQDAELHAAVAERLRAVSQRYTPVRRAVVDVLVRAGRPVSIPELLDAGPSLAQSSVYRSLTVLEEAGVVHRMLGPDGLARHELAEALTEHHHHLVCTSCGTVEDVPASLRLEQTVARAVAQAAAATGFRPHTHRLDLVGLCARCD